MSFFTNISFADPLWFLLLLLLPLYIWWRVKKAENSLPTVKIPTVEAVKGSGSWKTFLRKYLWWLQPLAFTLVVVALARPQDALTEEKVTTEGIDIVMALDISGSMLARDFEPDRLEASKNTAIEFVDNRKDDRMGLVVFAGESFTQCPITTDHSILKKLTSELKSGMVEDGTAIGMGLATAVNRLKDSDSDSKVIILLTDGVNNKGFINPKTAAETAKEYGIKVYTIGVGTQGQAPYPQRDIFGRTVLQYMEVQLDEELLKEIAEMTKGKYFRATDNNSLRNIYNEIDKLEKTEIEVTSIKRYTELFRPFALVGAFLMMLSFLLPNTILRGLP